MCTGPGRPSKATFTASSSTSQVSSTRVRRNDFLVHAANIASESGVLFHPEVSFSDPRPFQAIGAYPEMASSG